MCVRHCRCFSHSLPPHARFSSRFGLVHMRQKKIQITISPSIDSAGKKVRLNKTLQIKSNLDSCLDVNTIRLTEEEWQQIEQKATTATTQKSKAEQKERNNNDVEMETQNVCAIGCSLMFWARSRNKSRFVHFSRQIYKH